MLRYGELALTIVYVVITAVVWLPAQIVGHIWFLIKHGFNRGNKPML